MSPRRVEENEKIRSEAKARITKTALEIFAEYGFHGTKMSQIMEASGLSKGLVYHYFSSKEELFYHLVDCALEISRNTWNSAYDMTGTAWEKLVKLSENLVSISFSNENSRYYIIMMQALTQGKSIPGLLDHIHSRSAHFEQLPKLIAQAQQTGEAVQGDPEMLAATFIALFQGFTMLSHHDKSLEEKISPQIFTNILRKRKYE